LNLVNSGETAAEAEAATIPIRIPASTKEGSKAVYEIVEANLEYKAPKEENFVSTFSIQPESADVKGAFNLKADSVLIGKPSTITFTPTAANAHASVKINGKRVASGQESESISLETGINNIIIEVTAQNILKAACTITVTRLQPEVVATPVKDGVRATVIV